VKIGLEPTSTIIAVLGVMLPLGPALGVIVTSPTITADAMLHKARDNPIAQSSPVEKRTVG
jgi:hypothetical protein